MKKLLASILTAMILVTFNPIQSVAATDVNPTSTPETKHTDVAKAKLLETRLLEIDAMDKSNMSSSEKRVLRKEVRAIKREIQRDETVFISVGALLLIIILLIVLL